MNERITRMFGDENGKTLHVDSMTGHGGGAIVFSSIEDKGDHISFIVSPDPKIQTIFNGGNVIKGK